MYAIKHVYVELEIIISNFKRQIAPRDIHIAGVEKFIAGVEIKWSKQFEQNRNGVC